jgi:hypothetical protein
VDTDLRTCSRCEETLPATAFHTVQKRGKPYAYPYCKPCHRAYVRAHYVANKQAYIQKANVRNARIRADNRARLVEYLSAHPCVDCGEPDLVVLQFDHVRGTKVREVSVMHRMAISWETIAQEIAKCDVRCANCHIRQTAARAGWWNSPS